MTRINPDDVLARVPDEGIRVLRRLPEPKRIYPKSLPREWTMVVEPLRRVLIELAVGRRPWPLYLHGPVGHGKTRAVLAFCDRVAYARYWTVDGVMSDIIARDPPWGTLRTDLAVLDELGLPRPGNAAEFDYSAVKQFCDWRECRPAIYLSNHNSDEIWRLYDPRVQSRLTSGTVYDLVDRDRRVR